MIRRLAFVCFAFVATLAVSGPARAAAIVNTIGYPTGMALGTAVWIGDWPGSEDVVAQGLITFLETKTSTQGAGAAAVTIEEVQDRAGFVATRMYASTDGKGEASALFAYKARVTFVNQSDSILDVIVRSSFLLNTFLDVDNLINQTAAFEWDISQRGPGFALRDAFSFECGRLNPLVCGREFRNLQFSNSTSMAPGGSFSVDLAYRMFYKVVDIPEPGTLALLGLGLAGLAATRRPKQ